VISHFRTQKTGLLLAYLALHPDRMHEREELAELFWYDSDGPLSNLRMALPSLRRQLEPPGVGPGTVLVTGRTQVGLVADAVRTDVAEFRAAIAAAARIPDTRRRIALLKQGLEGVNGSLLPGGYLEWVLQERAVLSEEVRQALKELVELLTDQEDPGQALLCALRLVHSDPLDEEAHLSAIRLLIALKRPAAALKQFTQLTDLLRNELNAAPSAQARDLLASLLVSSGSVSSTPSVPPVPAPLLPVNEPVHGAAGALSLSSPPATSLPVPRTPFFGREKEIEQLAGLLVPAPKVPAGKENFFQSSRQWYPRILTIVGVGGSGKTRLALEVGRACIAAGIRNVCFVTLVDTDTPERMLQTIAETVQPERPGVQEPWEAITAALTGACWLLILDNMEQIADAGGAVVNDLLQRLPGLTVLVTSRQRLNIEGEREFPLLPLATPEREERPECLLEYASVELFVDRAQAVHAGFQLTERNAKSVGALCRRLEGLPLALELAASWAQTLSAAQMLARLERRFELLRTRRKGMAVRHQALDACIAWSFRLLPAEVQGFFCRLCLLRGEWTLETAEALTADTQASEKLQRLREASFLLVREAPSAEGTALRFHMLESLREFGLERLPESERDAGYARLAEDMIELPLPDPFAAFDAENIRAVVQWCGASPIGYRLELPLLNALMNYWRHHGGWLEGRSWLQEALRRHAREISIAKRMAWNALGFLHVMLDADEEARPCYERALTESEQADDPTNVLRSLSNLSVLAARAKDYAGACMLAEQSLEIAQRLRDESFIGSLLNNLGVMHRDLGDVEKARGYFERGLNQGREQNVPGLVALCLSNLAGMAHRSGDVLTARQLYEESLEIFRSNGEQPRVAETLGLLAEVLEAEGDFAQARRAADESARIWESLQTK